MLHRRLRSLSPSSRRRRRPPSPSDRRRLRSPPPGKFFAVVLMILIVVEALVVVVVALTVSHPNCDNVALPRRPVAVSPLTTTRCVVPSRSSVSASRGRRHQLAGLAAAAAAVADSARSDRTTSAGSSSSDPAATTASIANGFEYYHPMLRRVDFHSLIVSVATRRRRRESEGGVGRASSSPGNKADDGHGNALQAESLLEYWLLLLREVREGRGRRRSSSSADGGAPLAFVSDDNLVESFNAVITAWASSGHPGAGERAREILEGMERSRWRCLDSSAESDGGEEFVELPPGVAPTVVTYNAVMTALARSGDARGAEELLESMEGVIGDVEKLAGTTSPEEEETGEEGPTKTADTSPVATVDSAPPVVVRPRPDAVSYGVVMDAWARSDDGDDDDDVGEGARRAEAMLKRMYDLYRADPENATKPTARHFNAVLNAWSRRSGGPYDAAVTTRSASSSTTEAGSSSIRGPSWPQGGRGQWEKSQQQQRRQQQRRGQRPFAASRAEQLLLLMEKLSTNRDGEDGEEVELDVGPDAASYNIVIDSWAKSGRREAAERAEGLLYRMERRYQQRGGRGGGGGKGMQKGSERPGSGRKMLQQQPPGPDTTTFNCVIDAWSKSGRVGSAQAAEDLLGRMESLYRGGRSEVRPDCVSYTAVIDAWAKSGEKGSAKRAQNVLAAMRAMHKAGNDLVKPTTVTYNALLNAWAKAAGDGGAAGVAAASQAEKMLTEMEEISAAGDANVRPNVRSYTTVVEAWSKSGAAGGPKKAEALLELMEARHCEGNLEARPNSRAFRAVINAWARSADKKKAQKAQDCLKRMEEMYASGRVEVEPNVYAYNSVLNACAYTATDKAEEVEDAFKIACITFDELCKSNHADPNHVTYGTFLQVCSRLMSKGDLRRRMVEATFRRCCRDGQVGRIVLSQLRDAAPTDLYIDLLQDLAYKKDLTVKDVPFAWKRNVRESKRY